MPLFVKARSFLRNVLLSRSVEMDLDLEVHSHLEMLTEENIRAGMSPQEAQRAARLELGGIEQVKEQVRDERIGNWLQSVLSDCRYGLRQLRKNPSFTATAVLTLALGIGANTSIFSLVNSVLLRPLPYPDAGRLVMVWEQNLHRGWLENIVSSANFLDWKQQSHVFTDMAAFESSSFNLSGNTIPEEVAGERVTTNLFSVLGVQPFLGRLFLPGEEKRGSAVAVLSYGLWQQRYAGDPNLIDKTIILNGEPLTIVGILPASFSDDYSSSFAPRSQLWISGLDLHPEGRESHEYHVLARLRPGLTLQQAQADMDTIAGCIEQQYPESKGWSVSLVGLHDQVVRYTRTALLVLLVAAILVLLIACANVANLLLARGVGRAKETAVRTALGATRGQIVRQLLVESTLLSILGAALGLVLASWGSEILVRLSPSGTSRLEGAGINAHVLLFALALAFATGITFGLVPAASLSNPNVSSALNESGRSLGQSAKGRKLRDLLVACEFALALSLLVGAGLMVRTLSQLGRAEIGFNPQNLLSMKVPLVGPQYDDPRRQVHFFQQLLSHVEALPGVEAASVSRGIPIEGWAGWNFVTAEQLNPPAGEVPDANYVVVAPHYFRAMGIPLRAGRPFSDSDSPAGEQVAIVSESLARKYWPNRDPLGMRLKMSDHGSDASQPWLTVVGVAGNVRSEGQYAPYFPEIYVPYTQYPWILWPRHLVVRTSSNPSAIVTAIRREVQSLDKDIPVSDVAAMNEIVAGPVLQGKTITWLLGAFAALALLLASIGIYGVISCAVGQQIHEIGIRMALGAKPADILWLVLARGGRLALAGAAVGFLTALAMTRVMASLLFGVSPTDPLTFLFVSVLLSFVALAATYIPARRAAKVDPVIALRYE
jgi:putative ABC transport system permease protein